MSIVFIDLEVNQNNEVIEYGAYLDKNHFFRGTRKKFIKFIKGFDYVCGHNAFSHDYRFIDKELKKAGIKKFIDTLPLSALLFPKKTYHRLVKDYKLVKSDENISYADARITQTLFVEEIEAFNRLDEQIKDIYYLLLSKHPHFKFFFDYVDYKIQNQSLKELILDYFEEKICRYIDLNLIINHYPVELAYCLAIIHADDVVSHPPQWITYQYPNYMKVMDILRGQPCFNCHYCNHAYDIHAFLDNAFGYKSYRTFEGMNLQEESVRRQIMGKSILSVFPTAGGKSIAFQIPALIMAQTVKGLTIVISPLQSLMQDQVKNLKDKNIFNVGTINGSMNSIERAETIRLVNEGAIHLLYLAPETLRSPSIFKLLVRRNIVRFVIDEAHCFSTWGHEFRVDYLYIAEFIKNIMGDPQQRNHIPVSCFTATAKKEVIDDIINYFKDELNLNMEVITTNTRRQNLNFFVHNCADHKEKMLFIRDLIENNPGKPIIIYTSRRKTTEKVAKELSESGYSASPYHGGLKAELKNNYQLEFTRGEKNIIVATSAFGMGVDKDDVYFVIHYNVSSTIEDYIQEAGRAGRDKNINAECHILYNEKDVDEHFNLLTSQKLSQNDINQVWRAIKRETKSRSQISISTHELATKSGFDMENNNQIGTKIYTSILALERVNYIKRSQNAPRIYATSIVPKTMIEARAKIDKLSYPEKDKNAMIRIMTRLFTDKNTSPSRGTKPISLIEELIDYLQLGKRKVTELVNYLKDHKILNYDNDLLAKIPSNFNKNKSKKTIDINIIIMRFLLENVNFDNQRYHIKEINLKVNEIINDVSSKDISMVINFLSSHNIIKQIKDHFNNNYRLFKMLVDKEQAIEFVEKLADISQFIVDYSFDNYNQESNTISYSIFELKNEFLSQNTLFKREISLKDVEIALLFIIRSGALVIDGGFLFLYNPMKIEKLESNPLKQYTKEDYQMFMKYYNQKIKKIHILTFFIKQLSEEEEKGMILVDDYFNLSYKDFENKYITDDYRKFILTPMTKTKYDQLFNRLSDKQKEIIDDDSSKNIVVLAGPGSGKTTLLVHKLASLIRLEDVKPEQLLMLTFSRSATVVFKKKLKNLIGGIANYVDIKTFHSFCFDILGEIGDLEHTDDLFERAIKVIENSNVEESKINKSTIVIDEAQDMSEMEYNLVLALETYNEKVRIIAVGDDDQNIFQFRGSSSEFLDKLSKRNANVYELVTNFRSKNNLVSFTQEFTKLISNRLKSSQCFSNTDIDGNIRVFKYKGDFFYDPIVNQVIKLSKNNQMKSVAILTMTNEEAEIMNSKLNDVNIKSQLVQSNQNFRLTDLAEIQYFLSFFDFDTIEITKEEWKKNIESYKNDLSNNPLISNILNLLYDFETLYPNNKYMVDLKSFIFESYMKDLYKDQKEIVTISTIHKSKGREYDTVFIYQSKNNLNQDDFRSLYVGLTRAKNNLIIHTNSDIYDYYETIIESKEEFSEPNELIIQLSHRDIYLDGSKYCQNVLNNLSTGDNLDINDDGLILNDKQAMYFSKKFKELIDIKSNKNYYPISSKVTFKLNWYCKSEEKNLWIILPAIKFKKYNFEKE